jgi:L-aspartate oxidase
MNETIREITWRHAGIVRNAEGLKTGLNLLAAIQQNSNLLTVARIIHECALAREESRGAHYRDDFPAPSPSLLHSYVRHGHPPRLA